MLMKYIAIKGFSGLITMSKGEVKEINDKYIAEDLLKAGYIEPAEAPKTTPKTTKKTS